MADNKVQTEDYTPSAQATVLKLDGVSDSLANSLRNAAINGKSTAGSVRLATTSLNALNEDLKGLHTIMSWPYSVEPSDLAVLFDEEPTNRACCSVKAACLNAGGFKFIHKSKKGEKPSAAMESDFNNMFGSDGMDEFLTRVETDYGALGNAFIEILRDIGGKVKELVHVSAYTMYRLAPVADDKVPLGDYVQIVNGTHVYFREFGTEAPDYQMHKKTGRWPNEMVQLKQYTPANHWYGMPSIWSALFAALSNRLQHLNVIEFFEDKGISRYLLVMDGAYSTIDPKNQSTLTNYINSLMEVRSNKLVMIGTPPGTKSVLEELRTELNFDQYNIVREANRDEICRAHGVPPKVVSIVAAGHLGGPGEGESQFDLFKSLVVRPRQRVYERLFDKVFFSQYDGRRAAWGVQFNEIDLTDLQKKATALNLYVRAGIKNINEARAEIGEFGIGEEGEQYFINAGGVPVPLDMIKRIAEASIEKPNNDRVGSRESEGANA